MSSVKKKVLLGTAAVAAVILLVGSALTVGWARGEKIRYIESEQAMARRDLCAAADEMLRAMHENDGAALNRAAGRAEVYLSRAGLNDCGEIYREIKKICSGECGEDVCERFADAVRKAAVGDGGRALREISGGEIPLVDTEEETTEDLLAARMMKKLGKSRDEVALQRARAFACPNAEFDECATDMPSAFAYSGENVFVLVSGDAARVVMYCFDRDTDERYSVTREDAERSVDLLIKKEKLRLGESLTTENESGVYRTVCYGKGDLANVPLVTVEIYSDTGRLRLYDASSYYKYQS